MTIAKPIIIATLRKNAREDVVVSLSSYAGRDLLDIRQHVDMDDRQGERTPTRKGVSIRVEALPEVRRAIEAAEAEARALGLLPEDGK